MAYWKALAQARTIPLAELRDRYTEALFELDDLKAALDGQTPEEIRAERDSEKRLREDAEFELAEAHQTYTSDRLSAALGRIETIEAERDEALARLAKVEPLIDAYSDTLAFARRFVALGTAAGIKTRHVRVAKKTRTAP